MKSPTEIKQKIRNIEYEYLKKVYQTRLSKDPQNCVYNKKATAPGSDEALTRVCSYFTTDDSVQVCDSGECSQSCNAFVFKYDKRQLRELLQQDISTNPTKYPELLVLNWSLDGEIMEPDSTEPSDPVIVTPNVTASFWTKTRERVTDALWASYFKFNDILGKVFGR
jgi:hypothetical protein